MCDDVLFHTKCDQAFGQYLEQYPHVSFKTNTLMPSECAGVLLYVSTFHYDQMFLSD